METVSPALGDRLKVILRNMDAGKMIVVLLLMSAAIAGLVYMVTWAGKPDFQYLFTNLPQEDAAGIVARLKEKNIPFQIDGNGSAILVPKQHLYELRLEMAAQGLPQGSRIGFEIFDDIQLGMTDFIQNVNYQRALQGELSRTINKFDEVASSRVHIVIAEKSLFVEEEDASTASVVVNLRPGKKLQENQVQSIVHLVASSVSRLDMENITVVDNFGRMLTGSHHQSSSDKVNAEQLTYQRKIETDLENRITTMLESVLGRNKATVRVSCLIDFVKEELTEETYLPQNAVIRSEQQMNEKTGQDTDIARGIPGMASNVNQTQETKQQSTERTINQGFQRQDKTVNYEIGKVIKHRILPVGRLLKQSVAVVVDGTHDFSGQPSSKGKATYVPRTAEEMDKIDKLVKRAINFDADRGDEVEVQNIPFETALPLDAVQAEPAAAESWMSRLKAYSQVGRFGAAALFCLLVFLFIVRPLTRWITASSPWDKEIYTQLPKTIAEIESGYAGGNPRAVRELSHVSQAAQMMTSDNKSSAQLLQGWMGNNS
jgi:flagellar M-ring protein FliF